MSQTIDSYKQAFAATWPDDTPVAQVRFVVLDSETTGFSPRLDRILTIGAVAVLDGEIVIEDSFDALLRVTGDVGPVAYMASPPTRPVRGTTSRKFCCGFSTTCVTGSSSAITSDTTSRCSTPATSASATSGC